jgi:uncharacterized protein (DUF1015 family)
LKAELPSLVTPFRGERYAASQLSPVIAPPYDVIAREERAKYAARDPHNIVHLILPEAPGGQDRYALAAERLAEWRRTGVIVPDQADAIYVLAQSFALPSGQRRTRHGMFAAVAAEPFTTRRVRPHERTHAEPKADRLALLRATQTNLESIFLLAPDSDGALAAALVRASAGPPAARGELEEVELRLWVVKGAAAQELATLAGRAPLYIADGHHRYETAVAEAAGRGGAGRVLSLIVPASDPGLTILPTHRIIFGAGRDQAKLLAEWRRWFDVGRVAPCMDRIERLAELGRDRTACVVAFPKADDITLVLRADAVLDDVPGLGRSAAVRKLDVARVEALVVKLILLTSTATPSLAFTPDPYAAFAAVRTGGAAAAVLLNPTRVQDVFAVADAEDVMPPKSTYFVPKVPSGLVLRALP